MPRKLRILIALIALASTLAGTAIGRFGAAQHLAAVFSVLAKLHAPTPADLREGLLETMPGESLGEALVGLGLLAFVLLGARASRTSVGFAVACALVTVGATAGAVIFPTSALPGMAYLTPPPSEWPYGAVEADKAYWNVYLIRTPRNEWGVVVEHSNPLGPEGLKNALERRFAPGGPGKKPVRLYLDLSCPEDQRKVFLDAAHAAADPAGVSIDDRFLPEQEDLAALVRQRAEERMAPYRDTLEIGLLGRIASAAALALVVWWMPRSVRGGSLVTGGNLLLAFGQAVALPIALYAAVLPDPATGPDWKRLAIHIQPHLWISWASSAALVVGALVATTGSALAPDEPRESPMGAKPQKQRPPADPPSPPS